MTAVDYVVNLVLSGILIVGAYQFYFFTQRHPLRSAREFLSPLDEKIPAIRKSGLKRDQSSPASIMRMSVEMSAP